MMWGNEDEGEICTDGIKTHGKPCRTHASWGVHHCCSRHNAAGPAWCTQAGCPPSVPSWRSNTHRHTDTHTHTHTHTSWIRLEKGWWLRQPLFTATKWWDLIVALTLQPSSFFNLSYTLGERSALSTFSVDVNLTFSKGRYHTHFIFQQSFHRAAFEEYEHLRSACLLKTLMWRITESSSLLHPYICLHSIFYITKLLYVI